MKNSVDRRSFTLSIPAAGLAAIGLSPLTIAGHRPVRPPRSLTAFLVDGWPGFPKNDPVLVAEVVGSAHRSEAKVRELIDAHPALVNASWDWGFGDWESPLGAASHVGQMEIAELLISRGARVDIFAATMLGWLPTVRAMIEASPGVERTLGPHCITLLAHARAGGERAASVFEYLKTLPGADDGPKVLNLEGDALSRYVGQYAADPGGQPRFTVRVQKNQLEFVTEDSSSRRLQCIAPDQFFPTGVPSVRFTFEAGTSVSATGGRAMAGVSIVDHDLSLRCRRLAQ